RALPVEKRRCKCTVRMRIETRIINMLDTGMRRQPFSEPQRIFALPREAQRQRFHSSKRQPCLERPQHRTDKPREVTHFRGVVFVRDNYASSQVPMSAKILCRAVDHKIRAMLERPQEQWSREGVVYDHARLVAVRFFDQRRQIRNAKQRVRQTLEQQHLRLKLPNVRALGGIENVDELDAGSPARDDIEQEFYRHSVDFLRSCNRSSLLYTRGQQRQQNRRHSGRDTQRESAAFQRSNRRLQRGVRRIAVPGIGEACAFARADGINLGEMFVDESGGAVDGRRHGNKSVRACSLARVNSARRQTSGTNVPSHRLPPISKKGETDMLSGRTVKINQGSGISWK